MPHTGAHRSVPSNPHPKERELRRKIFEKQKENLRSLDIPGYVMNHGLEVATKVSRVLDNTPPYLGRLGDVVIAQGLAFVHCIRDPEKADRFARELIGFLDYISRENGGLSDELLWKPDSYPQRLGALFEAHERLRALNIDTRAEKDWTQYRDFQDPLLFLVETLDMTTNFEQVKKVMLESGMGNEHITALCKSMQYIYSPAASLFGLADVRDEIRDTAMSELFPVEILLCQRFLEENERANEKARERVLGILDMFVRSRREPPAHIENVRIKRAASVLSKMQRKDLNGPEDVFDLVAGRIYIDGDEQAVKDAASALSVRLSRMRAYVRFRENPSPRDKIDSPTSPTGYKFMQILFETKGGEKWVKCEVHVVSMETFKKATKGIWAHGLMKSRGALNEVLVEKLGVLFDKLGPSEIDAASAALSVRKRTMVVSVTIQDKDNDRDRVLLELPAGAAVIDAVAASFGLEQHAIVSAPNGVKISLFSQCPEDIIVTINGEPFAPSLHTIESLIASAKRTETREQLKELRRKISHSLLP